MNSDALPERYVWEPNPAFDYQPTPEAPPSQEATEVINHPVFTPVPTKATPKTKVSPPPKED